ncbi:MAG: hypothetical protein IPI59_03315 [Sphingobacteriales bacterium]|jgi:hypothetical protein|nr:hypothetical protein [Sphingobacteriales bacterium]MBP9140571.1 hypothetical protein [Chitinophagales bacterium]MDA0197249.1 hypothetical protein [Bacteroidota bacterium]MBK6890359.1 hypothetical protein [Sphingobacteriales bacterium]MBK7526588.1 hypothetical protein [Sphingobacteriales bacterium]
MHHIEPYHRWRDDYIASEDEKSPFYECEYNDFEYENRIYNFYIHPQWDDIGSDTLYIKLIYADYANGTAVCELIGEWNDCISSDIMLLKRKVFDPLIANQITKFILIGENVLNFHFDDEAYYEEFKDDIADENGWVVLINFQEHVLQEMAANGLQQYFILDARFNQLNWRQHKPQHFFNLIAQLVATQQQQLPLYKS